MQYMIKNKKNVYIRLNKDGKAVTCTERDKSTFEYSKARNVCDSLPRTLRRLNFQVIAIPDTVNPQKQKPPEKVIQKEDYIVGDAITQWVEKFGVCDDILTEARNRRGELYTALTNVDRELSNALHKIELGKSLNARDGFKEYKNIKDILERRRMIKDEALIIGHVSKMDFRDISSENIKKSVAGLANRKFTLRLVEEVEDDAV